ncbi:MAG: hypothetical protein J7549_14685 [Variovorax sp.]|nr:hypothetical protein [Variovorax sp.]
MATSKHEPARPAPRSNDARSGNTKVEQEGEAAPRLPHERDQSSDSQQTPDGQPPAIGRRALQDIEQGRVDTDRGPVVDEVYNRKVKP